jgi:hypothetical protein
MISTNKDEDSKIAVFCLSMGERDNRCRLPLVLKNMQFLSKAKYKNYKFYLLVDKVSEKYVKSAYAELGDKLQVVSGFSNETNYMEKIGFAMNRNHLFSIKMDDDTLLTTESWDAFFEMLENMGDDDLFCTGLITNGIPTCEMYLDSYLSENSQEFKESFLKTRFSFNGGVNYSPLNKAIEQMKANVWDSDLFYKAVSDFDHYYKGIHPVRINLDVTKSINEAIIKNAPNSLMFREGNQIIRDKGKGKYPYFCNNFFGIKTDTWRIMNSRMDLYVDSFDEVVLNRFRHETEKNMVIHTGIPILHTVYNWITIPNYEKQLIEQVCSSF